MTYRLIVFDIDGTLTTHISSWQFLHERLGIWDDLAAAYQNQFREGRISYKRFCELDAAHWKGMETDNLYELFREIPYSTNAVEAVRRLKEDGFVLTAVSSGVQFIVDRVREDMGLDYAVGNTLREKQGRLTGKVTIRISHLGKAAALRRVLRRFRIPAEETIVVGDSDGDVPMMKRAGYAIAFNPVGPALTEAASYVCRTSDFMEVHEHIRSIS
ncbi:MAG: HAD family phosphatase [Acidobacteria bacterium]|nr:HAD family phosphatase [Acidobacteriota bacterium]MBU2439265.1 HAD family phosphatase [Acidobacteriota bacterium]MBU4203159.1 HAD family phosphatase [Acidobacteriota bacterium]MBU4254985.1 HAD family phosphatase [Acidobacteriota bacterium]MBU4330915.1 HAD family phosphatase [Acidobacteriota bacterium]